MTKELYIDGKLAELDGNTKIDLQYKSFLFSSISSISAPRSWSVSLPPTARNLSLIGGSHYGDYSGTFPYGFRSVDYFEDSFQIIKDGKAIFTGYKSGRIEFAFTFGKIYDKIKTISEKKLIELTETSDDFLEWNRSISFNDMTKSSTFPSPYFGWCDFYSFTNEDRSWNPTTGNADVPYSVIHPTVTFNYIMNKIQSLFAITMVGLSSTFMNSCSFPLRNEEGVSILIDTSFYDASNSSNGDNVNRRIYFDSMSSLKYFDLINHVYFKPKFNGSNEYEITIKDFVTYYTILFPVNQAKLKFIVKNNSGVEREIPISVNVNSTLDKITVNDFTFIFNKDDSEFYFEPFYHASEYYDTTAKININTKGVAAYNSNTSDGFYPIIPNLPDMTCSDFIFQAMQLQGLFPSISEDTPNQIDFYSADVIYDNIPIAKDWSKKLVKNTDRMSELSDVEFKFGSYAQKNTLAYKKDETNTLNIDSFLTVNNLTLEDESKLVDLKFSAGKRFSTADKIIDYPLYDIKIDAGVLIKNAKTQSNDVIAMIENVSGVNYLKFDDSLIWSNLKTSAAYVAYQKLIAEPRYIKESFYLKSSDIASLDLTVPIYLEQYGKYYAIMVLQYKSDDFSDVELLEVKNI